MTSAEKLAGMIMDPLSEQMSQALGQQRVNLVNNVLLLRQAIEAVIRVARAEQRTELAQELGQTIAELVAVREKLKRVKGLKKLKAYVHGRIEKLMEPLRKMPPARPAEPPRADIIEERGCAAAPAATSQGKP
jgi:hypothetical protein